MKYSIVVIFSILLLTIFSTSFAIEKESIVGSAASCDLCEFTVGGAEYLIKNLSLTKTQVNDELQKICTIVPANISKECQFFMLFTGPVITSALFNGENPDTLCTTYKFCSPAPTSSPSSSVSTLIGGNKDNHESIHQNNNNNNNNNKYNHNNHNLRIKLNH